MQLPIERSPVEREAFDVAEVIVIDDVDDWADDRRPFFLDAGQKRFQPALRRLTVSIEENQDLAGGSLGSDHSGFDETNLEIEEPEVIWH